MRLATVDQAFHIDKIAQEKYDLSAEVLMEAAGSLSAREIEQSFLPELNRGQVAVVCGPGNNGADGLVCARHLHASGRRNLQVFLIAPQESRSALFKLQLKRMKAQGIRCIDLTQNPEKISYLKKAVLVVDAIFGIGLKREVRNEFARVIEAINACKQPKVALDTPSGLNADSGRLEGVAVKADMTVTFGLAKPGFFMAEGPFYCGRLRVLSIGFPQEAIRLIANTHVLFTEKLASRNLPLRSDMSNKSSHGRLMVLAGRPGFWGAGILSSSAAFRMGTGYVQWASFESPDEALKEIPEVLTGSINDESLWNSRFTAICVGPGLGTGPEVVELIERLRRMEGLPVVVDADALTVCANHDLFPLPENWIITPHSGELSRILHISSEEIDRDHFQAALKAYKKVGCRVLLKGFRSILVSRAKTLLIHSGNSALAKAGTGDVLSGMIGGLLAQGVEPTRAAATAAYIHGRMADDWVREGFDKSSLTASDLRILLPPLIARLRDSL